MGLNIYNYLEYLKDKKGNKDDKKLVDDQERLRFRIIKIKKPNGKSKKINSRKKSLLYLIAFGLTTNQYLRYDFKDLLIKSIFSFILQLFDPT